MVQLAVLIVPVFLAALGVWAEIIRRGQREISQQNKHIGELVNSAASLLRNDVIKLRKQVVDLGGVPVISEPEAIAGVPSFMEKK